ncbi:MAG: T9SS type A sorting domain-containing protein [Flavobacteriales bacterium]|nr:T9SS type A sorting domain-containing protein [Flavobacteriales bacterium]
MNKLIYSLTLAIVLIAHPSADAQNWNTDSLSWNTGGNFLSTNEKFLGESLSINDTVYRELYNVEYCASAIPKPSVLQGYIRQEGDMIYFRGVDGPPEIPLYDFGLEPGDIFNVRICSDGSYPYIDEFVTAIEVSTVDSVETLSGMRKRILFSSGGVSWIEGLGATTGLIEYSVYTCFVDVYTWLQCVRSNDALLFADPDIPNCCFKELGLEDKEPNPKIFATPNPVDAGSTIQLFGETETTRASLYDSAGRQLAQWNWRKGQSIDIKQYGARTGLYFLHFKIGNHSTVQKLVVL